jgi:DnaJ like chaperone protein
MNFWMIAALVGLYAGGVRGLIWGLVIGLLLSRVLPALLLRFAAGKVRQVQAQFLDSTFAVMGAVCKADGYISEDEIRAAETLFDRLHLHGEARDAAKRAFNRGKAADFDLDAEVRRFAQAAGGQPALLQMFMQVQISAIAADGEMHPAERDILVRITRGLGMSEDEIARLEALLRGGGESSSSGRSGRRPSASAIEDAYRVLGVPASASDAVVKRAYRVLMSQNHPDKLAAKGLPESMREMAEEKTREITAAYERIQQVRQAA